jgi:hypothetical protein
MKLQAQARLGVEKALEMKGISKWKASITAGMNQNQVARYLSGRNDMTIGNYERLCEIGLGMPVHVVLEMGRS